MSWQPVQSQTDSVIAKLAEKSAVAHRRNIGLPVRPLASNAALKFLDIRPRTLRDGDPRHSASHRAESYSTQDTV